MKSSRMVIGENLKRFRKATGWTQTYVAKQVGVEAPTYQRWEAGSNMPDAQNLDTLARIYNVSFSELFFSDGPLPEPVKREIPPPSLKESLKVICDELGYEVKLIKKRKKKLASVPQSKDTSSGKLTYYPVDPDTATTYASHIPPLSHVPPDIIEDLEVIERWDMVRDLFEEIREEHLIKEREKRRKAKKPQEKR